MRCPGRPVVAVGGAAQHGAVCCPGRRVQRVRGRPCRVGTGIRITGGAAAQVLRGGCGLAGRMPVDLGAFRRGEPGCSGTSRRPVAPACPVLPQPGQGEGVVQPAAAEPAGRPVRANAARQRHRIPDDLSGVEFAEPLPHQHTRRPQSREELRLTRGLSSCPGDGSAEHGADRRGRQRRSPSERIAGQRVRPPVTELRQRQIRRKFPAAVPDGAAVLPRCAGAGQRRTQSPHPG